MFMGFNLHFYIIFGTNLLTGGPTRIAVFFAYFSVSQKRNIKWSPNGMKPSGAIFLEKMQSRRLGVDVKKQPRRPLSAFWERGSPDLPACGLRRGSRGGPARSIFISRSSRPLRGAKPRRVDDRKLPQARPRQAGSRGGGEIKAGYLTRSP